MAEERANAESADVAAVADVANVADVDRVLVGRVAARVKGGLEVETLEGLAFCSLRQADDRGGETASALIGAERDFAVIGQRPDGVLLLSRRRLLDRERRDRLAEAGDRLTEGARVRTRVVRLSEHGVTVVLLEGPDAGLEGHVRREELAHGRPPRPSDVLRVGEEIEAQVRRFDATTGALALSRRAVLPEPWREAERELRPGATIEGRLLRATEFGAFIEIRPGVEGLLHRDEVPDAAWPRLEEATAAGAMMCLLVVSIDAGRRRAELVPAPAGLEPGERFVWPALRRGDVLEAPVERSGRDGVWLWLGPGRHGFIDRRELGRDEVPEAFPLGTLLRVEVVLLERGGRLAQLSRRKAQRRDERDAVNDWRRRNAPVALNTLGALLEKARAERRG